jgi:hypothetical protein
MTVKTAEVVDVTRADAEKRLVAASSVGAAVLLTGVKVAVGPRAAAGLAEGARPAMGAPRARP